MYMNFFRISSLNVLLLFIFNPLSNITLTNIGIYYKDHVYKVYIFSDYIYFFSRDNYNTNILIGNDIPASVYNYRDPTGQFVRNV